MECSQDAGRRCAIMDELGARVAVRSKQPYHTLTSALDGSADVTRSFFACENQ